jgi:predicted ATPase
MHMDVMTGVVAVAGLLGTLVAALVGVTQLVDFLQKQREKKTPKPGADSSAQPPAAVASTPPPPAAAPKEPSTHLPSESTPLIGREQEVAAVRTLLQRDKVRLVTLVGPPGTGKTRLGLRVAATLVDEFQERVSFVVLAPIRDAALVAPTIAHMLGVKEEAGQPLTESLKRFLRDKRMLLVLDNFEQVTAAAPLVSELLAAAPHLKVLVTSRAVLSLSGEHEFVVPPLPLPDLHQLPSVDSLGESPAVALFVQRAQAVEPDFRLTEENAPAVAELCTLLDGLPLAIELAAARTKLFSPQEMLTRLESRFQWLTGGARDLPVHQQTLQSTLDWSYNLLEVGEQTLLRRLGVFVGGCSLAAIESVCQGAGDLPIDVLAGIASLMDKSLLQRQEGRQGEPRFMMLETIREYAREKFFETDEVETVRDRHLDFFVQFAELVDENLKGGEQIVWQNRMAAEQDNLRTALEWGLSRNPDSALRIAGAANLFWTAGGYSAEGFRWTKSALEQVEKIPEPIGVTVEQRLAARARALRGLTRLYLSLGDNASAKRAVEESVALYRQSQDRRGLAFALVVLAYPLEFLGERVRAEAVLRESNAIARAEGDVYLICRSLNLLARVIVDLHHDLELSQRYVEESLRLAKEAGLRNQEAQAWEILGIIAMHAGDYAAARAHFKESVRAYQEVGATFNVILEKSNLAHLERQFSNYDSALEYYRETIVAFRDISQLGAVSHQLECFGFIALAQDQPERALQLFGAASALREKSGTPMTPDEQIYFDERLKELREKMDSLKFDSLWSQGRALTLESAIAYALEPDSSKWG